MKTAQIHFSELKKGMQVMEGDDHRTIEHVVVKSTCAFVKFDANSDERFVFDGLVTCIDWKGIWSHFNRMQKRVMADKTSKSEFFAEPIDERLRFYDWLQSQCGEYSCWM